MKVPDTNEDKAHANSARKSGQFSYAEEYRK